MYSILQKLDNIEQHLLKKDPKFRGTLATVDFAGEYTNNTTALMTAVVNLAKAYCLKTYPQKTTAIKTHFSDYQLYSSGALDDFFDTPIKTLIERVVEECKEQLELE